LVNLFGYSVFIDNLHYMVWFEFSLDMYYDYVTVWEWYMPKELEYNKIMYYN